MHLYSRQILLDGWDIEAQEKLTWASETLTKGIWADAIYHAYNVFVTGAKALLVSKGVSTNTQYGIIKDFEENFEDNSLFPMLNH